MKINSQLPLDKSVVSEENVHLIEVSRWAATPGGGQFRPSVEPSQLLRLR